MALKKKTSKAHIGSIAVTSLLLFFMNHFVPNFSPHYCGCCDSSSCIVVVVVVVVFFFFLFFFWLKLTGDVTILKM